MLLHQLHLRRITGAGSRELLKWMWALKTKKELFLFRKVTG